MNPATISPLRVSARAVAARLFRAARESAVARGDGSATGTALAIPALMSAAYGAMTETPDA